MTTSGFSFGANTAQTPMQGGFGGLGTTTTSGFLFGTQSTTTSTPGYTFGSLNQPSSSSNLFAQPVSTSTGLLSLPTNPSSSTTSTGFGNFSGGTSYNFGSGLGAGTALSSGLGGFGSSSLTTATTASGTLASRGLGGLDLSQTTTSISGTGQTVGKSDAKAIKEIILPNEILTIVESFKKYVKDQKSIREDIARMSSKPMFKVQEDIVALKQLVCIISNGLQRNATVIEKLKRETAQEVQNVEIAHRTKDTPSGLQYENTTPTEYFQRLVGNFEASMQMYRQQIEQMESHLISLTQPTLMSPQDLSLIMKKLHEAFVALAAQLYTIHEAVKMQKEHHLNYRRIFHGDATDLFENHRKTTAKTDVNGFSIRVGPTPFTGVSNATAVAMATALNRTQQLSEGSSNLNLVGQQNPLASGGFTTGLGSTFGTATTQTGTSFGLGSTTTGPSYNFGSFNSNLGSSSGLNLGSGFGSSQNQQQQNKPFQLQKPPPGNKRGKW